MLFRSHFHVAVMPCTAKKFEAAREEFKKDGWPDVDAVITTQELIRMISISGIAFNEIEPEAIDMPFGYISGAGVIFGVTGGVTEAALRNVISTKTNSELVTIANSGQRGNEGIKEFEANAGDRTLKIAVVSGLANAETIITRIKNGEKFDFVEVMACPGGCVCGGGQPFAYSYERDERGKGLYDSDKQNSIRKSAENPVLSSVYHDIIKDNAHELLHVNYSKRSK